MEICENLSNDIQTAKPSHTIAITIPVSQPSGSFPSPLPMARSPMASVIAVRLLFRPSAVLGTGDGWNTDFRAQRMPTVVSDDLRQSPVG
jgi:hypothetical protein